VTIDSEIGGLVALGDDAYCQVGPRGEGNQGILVTSEGSVLIDGYIRNYAPLMDSLNEVTKSSPVRYVVNTHDDMDHFSMNHFFRQQGATVLASEVCRASIHKKMNSKVWVDNLKSRNPELGRDIDTPQDLIPNIGIEKHATFTPGGEVMELIYMGHGHSPGDLVIYLPERKLLYAGDLVFAGMHGRCKTCDFGGILPILDSLMDYPCETVVPGHGIPIVGVGTEAIAVYKDYLVTLQQRIAELVTNGVSIEDSKNKFDDWKYFNWGRPQLVHTAIEHAYKDFVWRSRFQAFQTLHEDKYD
jgi:cyclase